MLLLIIFFSCLLNFNVLSANTKFTKFVDPKIVGGTIVEDRSQFAYLATLRWSSRPVCGGSIVDTNHVLTAAHCVHDYYGILLPSYYISIVVGNLIVDDTPSVHNVEEIIPHEDYNNSSYTADIALLKLSDPFLEWTDFVKPINLKTSATKTGDCIVSGWGTTSSGGNSMNLDLLFAEVPIVTWDSCKESYDIYLDEAMICAGTTEKDACQGDSGGPLVCDDKLAGIVSFGDGCAYLPGVYTEVAKHISWINDQIGYILVEPELDQEPKPETTLEVESSTISSLGTETNTETASSSLNPSPPVTKPDPAGNASQEKAIILIVFLGLIITVLNF